MLARTRFFGRYGNVIVVGLLAIFALIGIGQGDVVFPLLSGCLGVAQGRGARGGTSSSSR